MIRVGLLVLLPRGVSVSWTPSRIGTSATISTAGAPNFGGLNLIEAQYLAEGRRLCRLSQSEQECRVGLLNR